MLDIFEDSYDWSEAFKYASNPEPSLPLDDIDTSGFTIDDVVEIISMVDGENDGNEWVICGKLRDGRYFSLRAGCDYTGWDCQAGGSANVALTAEDIVVFGLGTTERRRLGLSLEND